MAEGIKATVSSDGKKVTLEVPIDQSDPRETNAMFMIGGTPGWIEVPGVKLKNGAPLRVNLNMGYRKTDVAGAASKK